jgi:hypothetical protein
LEPPHGPLDRDRLGPHERPAGALH